MFDGIFSSWFSPVFGRFLILRLTTLLIYESESYMYRILGYEWGLPHFLYMTNEGIIQFYTDAAVDLSILTVKCGATNNLETQQQPKRYAHQ